jgi:hypothetical protein
MESLFFGGSLFENGAGGDGRGKNTPGTAAGVTDGAILKTIAAAAEEE